MLCFRFAGVYLSSLSPGCVYCSFRFVFSILLFVCVCVVFVLFCLVDGIAVLYVVRFRVVLFAFTITVVGLCLFSLVFIRFSIKLHGRVPCSFCLFIMCVSFDVCLSMFVFVLFRVFYVLLVSLCVFCVVSFSFVYCMYLLCCLLVLCFSFCYCLYDVLLFSFFYVLS